jgi:signal transduction histidine kinase
MPPHDPPASIAAPAESLTDELKEALVRLETEASAHRLTRRRLAQTKRLLRDRANRVHALAFELARAEERERRRLSHVLHDEMQQLLAGARLHATLLESGTGTEEERAESLTYVTTLLDKAIAASRSLAMDLSPPILYEQGLAAALVWLGSRVQEHHGVAVKVDARARLGHDDRGVGAFAFQAARELLFNVVKHAHVKNATLTLLRPKKTGIRIVVADQGVGFTPGLASPRADPDAFGLPAIRERAEAMGGGLAVESVPGRGTRVTLDLPFPDAPLRATRPTAAPAARAEFPCPDTRRLPPPP